MPDENDIFDLENEFVDIPVLLELLNRNAWQRNCGR